MFKSITKRLTCKGAVCAFASALIGASFTAGVPAYGQQTKGNWMRKHVQHRVNAKTLSSIPEDTRRAAGLDSLSLADQRIVGGTQAGPFDNPFQVALLMAAEPDNFDAQFCGGSLIASNVVVTAAHCSDFVEANQVEVLTATRRLDGTGQRHRVARIMIHPDWNSLTFDNDVAVWGLATAARGVPLATLAVDDGPVGDNLLATGWGLLAEGGEAPTDLQRVEVPLVSAANCNDANSYRGSVTRNMICAGLDQGGRDSCQGDSGGPLTRGYNNATLTGITSWGMGCARPNLFGVYTRVSRSGVRNFIHESSRALAQDGSWNITNADVGSFADWVATSDVRPLTGDFNGDGRDDIALIRQVSGWHTVPVAFANGSGGWTITNADVGSFADWAATSDVKSLTGDFNGDGRDDIALIRQVSGWHTVPVAFANGSGGWNIANADVGSFAEWAATSDVRPLTGDFNGDGRDDIALIRQVSGWHTVPVAFANGSGGWTITNADVGSFAGWAATSDVKPLTGDFNGDGRDDIVLIRQSSGWHTVPVAFANGSGGWTITNGNGGSFAAWTATSDVRPLTGDFNGDGRDDIALIRQLSGWHTVPVAFANGSGGWTITNADVGSFAEWAATSDVRPLTGDFNGDGRDDIALIRQVSGWYTVPVAFANGSGGWNITNGSVGDFAGWAATSNVKPLTGDFNGDGRDDIALIRQSSGWHTVPVAFATNISPVITHQLAIRRHSTAALTNGDADRILADATAILQTNDGEGDVACLVRLARNGDVGEFIDGDGSIDTSEEMGAVFDLPGNVKIVDELNFCGNFNTSYIGCGQIPGNSFITERYTANQEGILWAHEFGHNQGLPHRNTSTNNLMYGALGINGRRINQTECNAFRSSFPFASSRLALPTEASSAGRTSMPVEEFVSQIYFEGLPLEHAMNYEAEDTAVLLEMLEDARQALYHENIALTLGMIGDAYAVEPLISYISTEGDGLMSRSEYKGKVGAVMALGYLVNLSGSDRALSYLSQIAESGSRTKFSMEAETAPGENARDLSKYAIFGLGLSGHPKAAEHLRSLVDLKGTPTEGSVSAEVEEVIVQSLQEHDKVSRHGLRQYYERE